MLLSDGLYCGALHWHFKAAFGGTISPLQFNASLVRHCHHYHFVSSRTKITSESCCYIFSFFPVAAGRGRTECELLLWFFALDLDSYCGTRDGGRVKCDNYPKKIVERGFRGSCETWQLCRLRKNGSSIDVAPLWAICKPGSGNFMLHLSLGV